MNIFEHFGAFWTKKGCKLIKNISKVISKNSLLRLSGYVRWWWVSGHISPEKAWNRVLSILRPRDWFGIVSGLSRDWFGSLSQKFRLELERNWFEIVSGFSRERLGEVGDGFWATFVVYSTYSPLLRRISMCSEWGLLALAHRIYSSKCPLDISRCGLIASSTTAKPCRGPRSPKTLCRDFGDWG